MKKKISFYVLIALIGFIVSCKKKEVDKLTEFDIYYTTNLTIPSASITVPPTPTTSVEFTTPNIPTQQSTKFKEEGTAQNLIDEIKMTRFTISAIGTGTTTANLDYLKSITIYIKASGVGETSIAYKSNIPTGISSIAVDLEDVNIKEYIFKDNIQFRVLAIFDASSSSSQTLKMDETVHVTAKLLK